VLNEILGLHNKPKALVHKLAGPKKKKKKKKKSRCFFFSVLSPHCNGCSTFTCVSTYSVI